MKALPIAVLMLCCAAAAPAADAPVVLSDGWVFSQTDGAALYRAICQGCHMPDGQGATGGGAYPALAGNARLASAPYVLVTVLRGRKGMPPFAPLITDAQAAAVVNYVRSNLGNRFTDTVSADDAKALR